MSATTAITVAGAPCLQWGTDPPASSGSSPLSGAGKKSCSERRERKTEVVGKLGWGRGCLPLTTSYKAWGGALGSSVPHPHLVPRNPRTTQVSPVMSSIILVLATRGRSHNKHRHSRAIAGSCGGAARPPTERRQEQCPH